MVFQSTIISVVSLLFLCRQQLIIFFGLIRQICLDGVPDLRQRLEYELAADFFVDPYFIEIRIIESHHISSDPLEGDIPDVIDRSVGSRQIHSFIYLFLVRIGRNIKPVHDGFYIGDFSEDIGRSKRQIDLFERFDHLTILSFVFLYLIQSIVGFTDRIRLQNIDEIVQNIAGRFVMIRIATAWQRRFSAECKQSYRFLLRHYFKDLVIQLSDGVVDASRIRERGFEPVHICRYIIEILIELRFPGIEDLDLLLFESFRLANFLER